MKKKEIVDKGNEFYWIDYKCGSCNSVESVPGPKRSDMDWQEFSLMLRTNYTINPHFRFCPNCKKTTRTILIAYDSN